MKFLSVHLPAHMRLALLVALLALLASCASLDGAASRRNTGDRITERLRLGMTTLDVDAALSYAAEWIEYDRANLSVESDEQVLHWYQRDYHPRDILASIRPDARYRTLVYWMDKPGGATGSLVLFFDERNQRLRGWVNSPSAHFREKFMHERITAQLAPPEGARQRMTRAQVRALLGTPDDIIPAFPKASKAVLEDHFWASALPTLEWAKQIEVYFYPLENGDVRRIYIAFYRTGDALLTYGYDRAWEEADRYARTRTELGE